MSMDIFPTCLCVPYTNCTFRGLKRALDPLELGQNIVVRPYVVTGNQIYVLWRSS